MALRTSLGTILYPLRPKSGPMDAYLSTLVEHLVHMVVCIYVGDRVIVS